MRSITNIFVDGPSAMTRVWLIRHGEPVEEARNRCYGSMDPNLSGAGRKQMEHIADYLKSEPISAVYTSPRSRALEGARILASTVSGGILTVAEDLRETDFGDFEGLTYDEIAGRNLELYHLWMENPCFTMLGGHGDFQHLADCGTGGGNSTESAVEKSVSLQSPEFFNVGLQYDPGPQCSFTGPSTIH
jgi:broad specificity phosphatase PhoE